MLHTLIGTKIKQTQQFDSNGHRKSATIITVGPCWISQVKTEEIDGYSAIQLGFGNKKNLTKPIKGHIEKAGLTKQAPRFFREVKTVKTETSEDEPKLGETVTVDRVFQSGDIVSITGTSKGKGFTGVMKRWGFAGGPATHGQSDRKRAPGSIGSTSTPGRVLRGKRMAGRSGGDIVTVKNLRVVSVDKDKNELIVSGLVPGPKKGLLQITVTTKSKKPAVEEMVEDTSKAESTNDTKK